MRSFKIGNAIDNGIMSRRLEITFNPKACSLTRIKQHQTSMLQHCQPDHSVALPASESDDFKTLVCISEQFASCLWFLTELLPSKFSTRRAKIKTNLQTNLIQLVKESAIQSHKTPSSQKSPCMLKDQRLLGYQGCECLGMQKTKSLG